jgi:hypothetical protein
MLRFPDRPDALPLNLIRGFEITSHKEIKLANQNQLTGQIPFVAKNSDVLMQIRTN